MVHRASLSLEFRNNFMKLKDKKNAGFTILEALVVVTITVLLSSALLLNGRKGSHSLDLKRGVQTLMVILRDVEGRATSAKSVKCGAFDKVPYYGLHIQQDSSNQAEYTIFADCDRDNVFNVATDDFIIEQKIIDGVFVNSTIPASGGGSYLDVVYIPPVPQVAVNGSIIMSGTFTIQLCSWAETGLCSSIIGNSIGAIEAD